MYLFIYFAISSWFIFVTVSIMMLPSVFNFQWHLSLAFFLYKPKLATSPAVSSAGPAFDSSIGTAVCNSPASVSSSPWRWIHCVLVMASFWTETKMLLSWSMIMDSLRRMPWNAHVGSNTSRTGDCWMPIPSTCLPSRMPPCQTQAFLKNKNNVRKVWPARLQGRGRNVSQVWKKIKLSYLRNKAWVDFLHPFAETNMAAN